MKAMQFNEEFLALPMEDFQNHYILVFDLTSPQDAAEQLHYSELSSGKACCFAMFFQFPLEQVMERPSNMEERLSNIRFNKFGTVAKKVYFFEFSGFYEIIVTFL